MKFSAILILSVLTSNLYAQLSGTVPVCSVCRYTSLTGMGGAFEAINSQGLNGNLILEIQSDLSESGLVSLNSWNETPTNANWTLNIRPDNNISHIISNTSSTSGGLIRITGADRVTIDGRSPNDNTLNFTNRFLTFRNTETNSPTISFSSDATFNVIRSCFLEGSNQANSGGVVTFGGGPKTGNDNNAIQYCDIRNALTNPRNAIYSAGSSKGNDNNAISYNNIYNFYTDATGAFNGVLLSTNCDGWTIQQNSFYQQGALTTVLTNQRDIYAIHVNNTGRHSILENSIGGDSPEASVNLLPWSISYASATLRVGGIWIEKASTTEQTLISKNIITNFSIINNSSVVLNDVFFGINVGIASDGSPTTGCLCSVEDNYVGSKADGSGTITIRDLRNGAIAKGIDAGGPMMVDILRNSIKNISITAPESPVSAAFIGIDFSITYLPSSNIINNDIRNNTLTSLPTTDQTVFVAIRTKVGSRANVVKNQIGSLTDASKANSVTINNCTTCTASYTMAGILAEGLGNANSIQRNIIGQLILKGTTLQSNSLSGIQISGDVSKVTKNSIANIETSGVASAVYGIYVKSLNVEAMISNNMIVLGLHQTGDVPIIGIYSNANNANTLSVVANSVAITGAGNAKSTFGFYRNGSTPVGMLANLFYNDRSGVGSHFAIGTNSTNNWAPTTSNYNLLFASVQSNTGLFGTATETFTGWQTVTSGDLNSTNYNPSSKFISLGNADLRIPDDGSSEVNDNIIDKGGSNPSTNVVSDDIDGAQRLNIVDIGASEVLINWIGGTPGKETDWFTETNWSGGIPKCGIKDRIKIRPTTFQPEITGPAEFRDMAIIRDATLSVSGNGSLTQCSDAVSPYGLVINGSLIDSGEQPFTIRGDFTQNNVFDSGTGSLVFDGSLNQHIRGDQPYAVNNFAVNGGGPKIMEQKVTVNGELSFINGIITTTTASVLTLGISGSYTGGSGASYVDGPMAKQTKSVAEFEFPIGKNGTVRPIGIIPNNSALTIFTAEYFNQSALDNIGSAMEGSLVRVSNKEYWTLIRSGISDAYIKLIWDSRSGVSTSAADRGNLRVAQWDGAQWNNQGGSLITGTQNSGSVTSDIISTFGTFTFGSEVEANPLPIELVSFKAEVINGKVKLTWVTSSEFNNDYFTIERLAEGDKFQTISRVSGHGTTHEQNVYVVWDNKPMIGISYYRLKQTDRDKSEKAFPPVPVTVNDVVTPTLAIYPNPALEGKFTVALRSFNKNEPISIRIIDLTGRVHFEQLINSDNDGIAELQVLNTFASGLYLINVSNGLSSYVDKVVIRK